MSLHLRCDAAGCESHAPADEFEMDMMPGLPAGWYRIVKYGPASEAKEGLEGLTPEEYSEIFPSAPTSSWVICDKHEVPGPSELDMQRYKSKLRRPRSVLTGCVKR